MSDVFACGCRWVKVGSRWWHVVACPQHKLLGSCPKPESVPR